MRNLVRWIFPVLFVLSISAQLRAQDVAAITGVVTDQSGAVVPAATVVLENPQTGAIYKTVGNAEGSYTINEVKPGPGYKITFTHSGFKPTTINGVYLNVDATRTENVKLGGRRGAADGGGFGGGSRTVTLDTTDAIRRKQLPGADAERSADRGQDEPLGAVLSAARASSLDGAVTGAREDQSNVSVDGLEVNDNATGQFGAIVGSAPVDSVQEFRGVTAGAMASEGQGAGGQFELVTKSGTNSFHGALDEYHRDTDLEANDWFNNNFGVGRPPLVRNQFGGNIGGPIW